MKKVVSVIVYGVLIGIFSCTPSIDPVSIEESSVIPGAADVTVKVNKVGSVGKDRFSREIALHRLYITLSAPAEDTIFDTIALSGNQQQTMMKSYSNLASDPKQWTLLAESRDSSGMVIHKGDTSFVIPANDTIPVTLSLQARYSMLVAYFFPIPDSATRCEIVVDTQSVADSSFAKQTLLGDTVRLAYDYLSALPFSRDNRFSETHQIKLNVYGDMAGSDTLLYTADTTIVVNPGENSLYNITLQWVGPDISSQGNVDMSVILGTVGTVQINGNIKVPETFTKTYGGSADEEGRAVHQTFDSGYVIVGYTGSLGAGNRDVYLVKVDRYGNTEWEKTYGGPENDEGFSVQQTADSGYIIAGFKGSATNNDAYIIKTDYAGNVVWEYTYNPDNSIMSVEGYSIRQTSDGGYILAGKARADVFVSSALYILKVNASGSKAWDKQSAYTADIYCKGYCVRQTPDQGYVTVGSGSKYDTGDSAFVCLYKTFSSGSEEWSNPFAGDIQSRYWGYALALTSDNGFIIAGAAESDSSITQKDVYMMKTDGNGDSIWTKTLSGTGTDVAKSIVVAADGGFLLCGYTNSSGAGNMDMYLIKTDNSGNQLWSETFGGVNNEEGNEVKQTFDGGYVIIGYTNSYGSGGKDIYLIKRQL